MELHDMPFRGHYEHEERTLQQTLQFVSPENEIERDLLAWVILPHAQTLSDDPARRNYWLHYQLTRPLEHGLYELRVTCRDASNSTWVAEIAAGVILAIGGGEGGRKLGFERIWLIDESAHFRSDEAYGGPALGRLEFGEAGQLPHRRLFGATIGALGR